MIESVVLNNTLHLLDCLFEFIVLKTTDREKVASTMLLAKANRIFGGRQA
jgi:hypothetical protein